MSFGSSGMGNMLNPHGFFKACLTDYHDELGKHGVAKKGMTFIPELMLIGKQLVLDYFRSDSMQDMFDEPAEYYYFLCELSYMAGVAVADKWHHDFSALQDGFIDRLHKESPIDMANPILMEALGLDEDEQEDELIYPLYVRWSAMHEPYWELQDPRDYTFHATLAVFFAGVSTILQAYGY